MALLQGDASLTVITGPVPAGQRPPYVRLYVTVEWPSGDPNNSLTGDAKRAVGRYYCHSVGANDLAAVIVDERVRTQLLNQRPAVAGVAPESVGKIQFEQNAPPIPDESTGMAVIDALSVYSLAVDT
jgi:hypothetical protein